MANLLSLLLTITPLLATASPIQGCTSTTTLTLHAGPETWVPTITETKYAATATVSEALDCGGCTALETDYVIWDHWYSEDIEYATETVTDTKTLTEDFCAASQYATAAPEVVDIEARRCTTTLTLFPSLTSGPTKTVWTMTKTRTYTVDCGGCDTLATTTFRLGPGPQVVYTYTTTVPTAWTVPTYVCSTS